MTLPYEPHYTVYLRSHFLDQIPGKIFIKVLYAILKQSIHKFHFFPVGFTIIIIYLYSEECVAGITILLCYNGSSQQNLVLLSNSTPSFLIKSQTLNNIISLLIDSNTHFTHAHSPQAVFFYSTYIHAHFLYPDFVISFGLCRVIGVCTAMSQKNTALSLYPADLNHCILYHTVIRGIKILFAGKCV